MIYFWMSSLTRKRLDFCEKLHEGLFQKYYMMRQLGYFQKHVIVGSVGWNCVKCYVPNLLNLVLVEAVYADWFIFRFLFLIYFPICFILCLTFQLSDFCVNDNHQ